ncbi:F-actin-monooxygenase mical1 isoform X2 [Chiloscyllium plagiosum]|uniref:F-actin-monooxygenase mical1 isoform X2 n=1 Tax=Chiloscyllium plagiosum TaxID=36176 RepID=UPI001CB7BB0D|nr:F-actin-monooxygenase mical1 isoform X2 [Chiloscyllium plagiosum]
MDNEVHSLFDKFLQGKTCKETLSLFHELCHVLHLDPADYRSFYQKLKGSLNYWKAKALWVKLDKRASHPNYEQGQACANTKSLVLGAGPCGLRTAIELAFLGAKVVIVEKRESFSRNNVLHLWPFTIHDLRALGAKKFYGKFCSGSLDHISIRQLQLILLKVALILGVEVHVNVEYKGFIKPPKDQKEKGIGWRADLLPTGHSLSKYEFDVFVSAGGGKYVPEGFKKKEMRGKLAIGITANFINYNTTAEAKVEEISGVAYLYNQKFFQQLRKDTGIDLENIVYYKDDTHYFVMTARKQSLLKCGVIEQDKQDADSLLSPQNVCSKSLLSYAQEAANFATKYQLPHLEFAQNHRGEPDVAMFDFTCMYRSENAALVKERHGHRLLVALVGDCLVEPFWPLGTGIARGFLAAFDAAWLVRKWSMGTTPLELLAERESIYQLLSQTTPENTNKNISQYSIDPHTRYPNLNLSYFKPAQVQHLYDVGRSTATEKDTSQTKGKMLRSDSCVGYEELLSWCQQHTRSYRNVKVVDLTTSWKTGLALCALIHHFRPDLIDFESLKEESVAENNQLAFNIAEKEFGISPIMTGREMEVATSPDKLSMFMYLTQFNEFFKDISPELHDVNKRKIMTLSSAKSALLFLSTLRKSVANKRSSVSDAESEQLLKEDPNETLASPSSAHSPQENESSSSQPEQFQENSNMESASRQGSFRQAPGPSSSEVCYFCKKRVYVVERFSAEGQFFHRGCFTCHQCGTTLRLGNYAFNSRDGKFYCTLHYTSLFGTNQSHLDKTAPSLVKEEALDVEMMQESPVKIRADPNPAIGKDGDINSRVVPEDQMDNENEWERGIDDEETALMRKYNEEDILEGLQVKNEDEGQGVESSSQDNKDAILMEKEHSRVPIMRHLTSPGKSPAWDTDQAIVSHPVVKQLWSSSGMPMRGGSNTDSNFTAGSERNSMDYKKATSEADMAGYNDESPFSTTNQFAPYLSGIKNTPFSLKCLAVLNSKGIQSDSNTEKLGVSQRSSTPDKTSMPRLEVSKSNATESLPLDSAKTLDLGEVNRTRDAAESKGAFPNGRIGDMPEDQNKSKKLEDVEGKLKLSYLSKELASMHFDMNKSSTDEEESICNSPMKKLGLSASLRRKLARLSVSSDTDSESQEERTQPRTHIDDTMHSEGTRLYPGKGEAYADFEPGDSDKEWEILDHPSLVLSKENNRSLKEQEIKSQVCWDTSQPALKEIPGPNSAQLTHSKTNLENSKTKRRRELEPNGKRTGKDSASETPNKSKLKFFSLPKPFSRLSRREKKNEEKHANSTLPVAKAEIPTIQVSSAQKGVKSCNLSGDEQSDDDEDESLSEDEMKSNTEPIKTLTPEEVAAKRQTWKLKTFERRARQEEMARFAKAQMIQRRLEEIEQTFHDLEQRGIHLEQEMRNNKGEQQDLMQSWITLVQDKNQLLSEESELMIQGRELELEDQKSRLEQDLRRYMNMDESLKTSKDHLEEERIFKEMIEVVKMRDKLVAFLEQQRLREQEQRAVVVPGAAAKDLTPVASITWV